MSEIDNHLKTMKGFLIPFFSIVFGAVYSYKLRVVTGSPLSWRTTSPNSFHTIALLMMLFVPIGFSGIFLFYVINLRLSSMPKRKTIFLLCRSIFTLLIAFSPYFTFHLAKFALLASNQSPRTTVLDPNFSLEFSESNPTFLGILKWPEIWIDFWWFVPYIIVVILSLLILRYKKETEIRLRM